MVLIDLPFEVEIDDYSIADMDNYRAVNVYFQLTLLCRVVDVNVYITVKVDIDDTVNVHS
jgi:hypothetical protein